MDVNRCVCCGDPIPEGIQVCPLCEQGYTDRYLKEQPEERSNIMTKEDWIRKLTSRKFWIAVAGLVTGIIGFLRNPTTDSDAITSLILALGSVVAYCLAEGLIDAARESGDAYYVEEEKPPENDG